MKEETLEELAERLYPTTFVAIFTQKDKVDKNKERRKLLIEGAKWQQEQDRNKYSKEEVVELLEYVRENFYDTGSKWHSEPNTDYTSKELIEKFKKE